MSQNQSFNIVDRRISTEEEKKAQELADKFKKSAVIASELQKSLKPLGFYNIPSILDQRRLEYGIPNGAFESYPTFDKVYIYQIPLPGQGGEKWTEGGLIVKPEMTQHYERETAPRGIVVSAGLQALDSLRSTGIEVGHIVRFKKLSPFIMPVAEIQGKWFAVYVVRDGDIEASEDLAEALNSRRAQIVNVSNESFDHRICNEDGVSTGKKLSAYYDPSI